MTTSTTSPSRADGSQTPASGGAYRWWVVAMLWFVCFFNYADRQAIFSVFPLLKSEMRLSDMELGVVASSFMWVYAIVGPVAGWLGDRFSRKALILAAVTFWSVITAATALAESYTALVVCRALGGFGEAFYFPAAMSMLSDYHGPATRSRAMALHQSAVYAGSVAGGTLSGLIAESYGWRHSFVWFGLLGVLLSLALAKLLREPARGQLADTAPRTGDAHFLRAAGEVLRLPAASLLIAVFVGANFVAVVFLTWLPSFLYSKHHLSLAMAGFSATVYLQIASVLGVMAGGWMADAAVRRTRGGRIATQMLGLLAGAPFLFLAGWSAALSALIVAMIGVGICKGVYDSNIFASLHDVVPVERRAVATGLMNSIGWLGGSLAPLAIATGAVRYGMSACISATAAIYLVLAAAMAYMAWRCCATRA